MGSAFNSEDEAPLKVFEAESSSGSEYDSEEVNDCETIQSGEEIQLEKKSLFAKSRRSRQSKQSKENLNQFNPLRFLAMSLKERHRDKITLKAKEETL